MLPDERCIVVAAGQADAANGIYSWRRIRYVPKFALDRAVLRYALNDLRTGSFPAG